MVSSLVQAFVTQQNDITLILIRIRNYSYLHKWHITGMLVK